jgi:ABC-type sugar transport system ATPase subunit
MADVRIDNLSKSFGAVEVLRNVQLDIRDGSFVVLVGPSGCGKSTLLRTIAGLERASSGTISIGGRPVNDLPPAERQIAMVFQSYALYPHMNVYNNMAFGLKFARTPRSDIDRRVHEAARILRLEELLKRKPRELSGGQRQRVAIGRAIVREPEVFLFDEPLSNLDAALRVNTRVEIAKLHKMLKATIIYVTHDQVEAMTLADVIVVMNGGRIEQMGKPLDLYYRPANLFVAGFIGSPAMNMVPATVASAKSGRITLVDGSTVSLDGVRRLAPGTPVTIGIRPEHLHVEGAGALKLRGTVDLVERLGETGYAYVTGGDGKPLTAEVRGDISRKPGEVITLSAEARHVHLFDSEGRRVES